MIKQQKANFPNIKIEEIPKFNNLMLCPHDESLQNYKNFDINYKETFDEFSGLKLK